MTPAQPTPSDPELDATPRHPIAVVADRTGLSQDLLRMWERRYGAVSPARDEGGQRLYSDADVERLRLLEAATSAGRRIGSVAQLPTGELAILVAEDRAAGRPSAAEVAAAGVSAPSPLNRTDGWEERLQEEALALVQALDGRGLDALLRRSAAVAGVVPLLERAVAPLLRRIGDEWHRGRLGIAQEHLASAVVEGFMSEALRSLAAPAGAPTLLVATPAGSRHVLGAALVSAVAGAEGWNVIFLGGDLPAAEIATAAHAASARAVAISVVYIDDDRRLVDELRELRDQLPASVPLVVGGTAMANCAMALSHPGIEVEQGLDDLRALLRRTWTFRVTDEAE